MTFSSKVMFGAFGSPGTLLMGSWTNSSYSLHSSQKNTGLSGDENVTLVASLSHRSQIGWPVCGLTGQKPPSETVVVFANSLKFDWESMLAPFCPLRAMGFSCGERPSPMLQGRAEDEMRGRFPTRKPGIEQHEQPSELLVPSLPSPCKRRRLS